MWHCTIAQVLGAPCGDLRTDADVGLGTRESLISRVNPGTGFYKVSTCIYGFAPDSGLQQRVGYYITAMQVYDASFAPPLSPHDACIGGQSHTVTLAELQAMTGHECPDCATHLPHLNTAVREADMQCPLRIAALVAVVDYDTAQLTAFLDPATNAAGAVKLPPAAFRDACTQIPTLEQAFKDTFTTCALRLWRPCECGAQSEAAALVAQPEFAWRVAAWWFVHGAAQLTGPECGDLRLPADEGQGTQSQIVSAQSLGTGFYHVAVCRCV